MTIVGYITFLLLALFAVFFLRGGLMAVAPDAGNFLRHLKYHIDTWFSQYSGRAEPVDPEPTKQFIY